MLYIIIIYEPYTPAIDSQQRTGRSVVLPKLKKPGVNIHMFGWWQYEKEF